ncbi:MAG: PIG-L family deacetylase [Alphaproteobacteria bacterium]|nr:PIG-L family deacetylase [Alphaproteobacteria bacterium]
MNDKTFSASMAPFREAVDRYKDLLDRPLPPPPLHGAPLGTTLRTDRSSAPCAVLLAPHPDDETLTGGLPLRLRQEEGWRIVVIATTLGSNETRRTERKAELADACAVLDFEGVLPAEEGLNDVTLLNRENDPLAWNEKVACVQALLQRIAPQALFIPHSADGHATHIGTHVLGMDALAEMPKDFSCALIETEYWTPLRAPNALIGLAPQTVAQLMAALACHKGEVARNPYDRRFPAFLIDSVRRSEPLFGAGTATPPFAFGQLCRQGRWIKGRFIPSALRPVRGAEDSLATLFA